MAYYYKVDTSCEAKPLYKGFHLEKVKKSHASGPRINFDFSKHVLIELLDDTTPESVLWDEMGLRGNKTVVLHKRMMIDSHRMKCRRAIVICVDASEARLLAQRLSQARVMKRCICAAVVQDLLTDLCLFEKQVIQCGDTRPQQQLLYVSDLSRSRGPSGLVKFLRETFSQFGTILSVLVCADDDDYAFPEGVVKFAYLSEAFAAELALDQYVVGKERLSVTTHHNILLSQCDLRARLRDAQWCCNAENISMESPDATYALNDLGSVCDEPVVNSMNSLRISHFSDIIDIQGDSKYDEVKFPPAYSQRNFQSDPDKVISCVKENVTSVDQDMAICLAETLPIDMMVANVMGPLNMHHNDSKEFLKLNKDLKNNSDCDSFVTCDNSLDPHYVVLSSKKTVASSYSQKTTTVSEYHSVSSNSRLFPSSQYDNLNESEVAAKPSVKNSVKRRKKFTQSQKLCLKSQRTALSQSSVQDASATQEISQEVKHHERSPEGNLGSFALKKYPEIESRGNCSSTKVASWLSHLPSTSIDDTELLCDKESMHTDKNISSDNSDKRSISKISVHKTPSLKSNLIKNSAAENSENEDPNKCRLISSNGVKIANQSNNDKRHEDRISVHKTPSFNSNVISNSGIEDPTEYVVISSDETGCIPMTDKSKTPLQTWLKQELAYSTNNCVTKSQKTSKSVIVCATRTKDVVISVGCSHMTCDSCYPESTDLLLGYD